MPKSRKSPIPAAARVLSADELAITRYLLSHGPATRGDLGDRLNVSYTSMSRAARALVRDGMAAEALEAEPAVGRPRQILTAVPGARHVVGCKLTADTVYAVLCDMFGNVVHTTKGALPPPGADGAVPVAATVKLIAQLTARLARRAPSVDGLAVALGGVVTGQSIVREGTFLGWRDVDLATPLTERTGLPVVVTNDVTALARDQLWFGAGRSHSTFGVITVGAGLGFGVVREGVAVEQLIDNGHLLAHSPVDSRGPQCQLGHPGCAAAYLNREDIEGHAPTAIARPITLAKLADLREQGQSASADLLDAASRALGHLVATLAGALQTTCIVLAGEDIATIADSAAMKEAIAERTRPGTHEVQQCAVETITTPLTFTDWARGAAVVGIQSVLGAP